MFDIIANINQQTLTSGLCIGCHFEIELNCILFRST